MPKDTNLLTFISGRGLKAIGPTAYNSNMARDHLEVFVDEALERWSGAT